VESVKRQQAQADKAYDIQANIMQQQVAAEAVKIRQSEKEQEIRVQEAEILRHEKELIATVLKNAEVERHKIERWLKPRSVKPWWRQRAGCKVKPKPKSF
jgi:flotillin